MWDRSVGRKIGFGYSSWDGEPAFYSPGEAYVYRNGKWIRANSAVIGFEARPMSEAEFEKAFGRLPLPPYTQRNSGDASP